MKPRIYFGQDAQIIKKYDQAVIKNNKKVLSNQPVSTQSATPQPLLWDLIQQENTQVTQMAGPMRKSVIIPRPGSFFIKETDKTDKAEKPEQVEKSKKVEQYQHEQQLRQLTRETNDRFFTELREQKEAKMVKSETPVAQKEKEKEENTQNTEFKFQSEGEESSEGDEQKEEQVKNGDQPTESKQKKKPKLKLGGKNNFVKQDLKKIYKDKFRGNLARYQKKFKSNGRLKKPERTEKEKLAIELQMTNNQGLTSNNIFIQSISKALLMIVHEEPDEDMFQEIQTNNLIHQLFEDLDNDSLYYQLLDQIFGFKEFRAAQLESIKAILKGESVLMVQKTGHGKSLVYQFLSSLYRDSVCIVFSPLIALMIDQINNLPDNITGLAYHSQLTSFQREKIFSMVLDGKVRIIFCTPEIFQSDLGFLIDQIPKISFVCIDEAHCISELSHSFRHTYFTIDQMIRGFLKERTPPYLAITATATLQTVKQIVTRFNIKHSFVAPSSVRQNLKISISRDRDVNNAVVKLIESPKFRALKSIIVYCRSRYMVDVLSGYLRGCGFDCLGFHSQLNEDQKLDIQNKFMNNQLQIIVATNIFAMGIDKPDIRAVIHFNMPRSMEAYLQEIGRAGRDGRDAYCHMFLNDNDFFTERSFIIADTPDKNILLQIYTTMKKWSSLGNYRCLDSKQSETLFDAKKDNIYTIMRLIEKCSQGKLLVYPICGEKLIFKFLKKPISELKQVIPLIQQLSEIGKVQKGFLYVDVITASNSLQQSPQELIRNSKQLFKEHMIMCDIEGEIFPFKCLETLSDSILEIAFEQQETFKGHQIDKLNYLYLTSMELSLPNVERCLESQLNLQEDFFDNYFLSENALQVFLNKYLNDTDADELLPFQQPTKDTKEQIKVVIERFIFEETYNKLERQKDRSIREFTKQPKILARMLCGISSVNYPYQEFRKTIIWQQMRKIKYEKVLTMVQEIINENYQQYFN